MTVTLPALPWTSGPSYLLCVTCDTGGRGGGGQGDPPPRLYASLMCCKLSYASTINRVNMCLSLYVLIGAASNLGSFTYYPMRSCAGRNELYTGSSTGLEDCASKCTQQSQCVSFEFWPVGQEHSSHGANHCQVSSSCTHALSTPSTPGDPADLYVFTGATTPHYCSFSSRKVLLATEKRSALVGLSFHQLF